MPSERRRPSAHDDHRRWLAGAYLLALQLPTCPLRSACTTARYRRIRRWEHEAVLDTMQRRLDHHPEAMRVRRQTVEHVLGTLKAWMGSTHFLMRTLPKVAAGNELVCAGLQHETGDQDRRRQGIDARHRSMTPISYDESLSMALPRHLATHDFVFSHSLGRKRVLAKSAVISRRDTPEGLIPTIAQNVSQQYLEIT